MSKKVDAKMVSELNELFHETLVIIHRALGGGMISVVHEYELTLPQIITLDTMARSSQTVSSLAAELRFSPGAVSRLVERLVRKKFINREEGDGDRRRKTLSITPIGRLVFDQLERTRSGSFATVMSELDASLAAEFRDVLRRVVELLQSQASALNVGDSSEKSQPSAVPVPRKKRR